MATPGKEPFRYRIVSSIKTKRLILKSLPSLWMRFFSIVDLGSCSPPLQLMWPESEWSSNLWIKLTWDCFPLTCLSVCMYIDHCFLFSLQALNRLQSEPLCEVALLPVNRKKNSYPEVLPCEYIVCLLNFRKGCTLSNNFTFFPPPLQHPPR